MIEVLAPIGSIQALKSAIYSGADAVYLGLDMFNARIKADNFTKDNIKEYVDYCHLFGVKVYITFNTNIKQCELDVFEEYVRVASQAKVDAFIVTDIGCLQILRKYNIPLHASTQMGVHNLAGAKVLEDLGFTRVVVARETLFEDIAEIRKNTKLEIEYFVHGALCVSFSGGCLMSSMMSGDSGNRGRCNQPCRLKYSSDFNNKESYLLSPKDQCLIEKLNKLIEIGVDSLKIEGRLKQPHYVGEVVAQYRQAVDNIIKKQNNSIDYSALKRAYNRGNFTSGYNYAGTKDIMYDKINSHIGEIVGKIVSSKTGELEINLQKNINIGDGLKIIKNNQEVGGLSVVSLKKKGDNYIIPCQKRYDKDCLVCLTLDTNQVEKYKNISPKLSIDLLLYARLGKPISLRAKSGNIEVCLTGENVEMSLNHKAYATSIKKQLSRLGDTIFDANIQVDIDENENIFLPQSVLNNLRRSVIKELENKILSEYDKNRQIVIYSKNSTSYYLHKKHNSSDKCFVEIGIDNSNLEFIDNIESKVNLVVDINDNVIDNKENIDIILKNSLNKNKIEDIYLKLPKIARGKDFQIIENIIIDNQNSFDGILADNLYAVYLAKKYNKKLMAGIGLNIFNNLAKDVLGLDEQIMSVELNKKELLDSGVVYSYGLLPIMTFAHCPIQLNTKCTCSNCMYDGDFYYYDKRGKYLIKRIKLSYCQFVMYNQQIMDIIEKLPRNNSNKYYNNYINLCNVDLYKKSKIVQKYIRKSGKCDDNSTCGHLFRGVK